MFLGPQLDTESRVHSFCVPLDHHLLAGVSAVACYPFWVELHCLGHVADCRLEVFYCPQPSSKQARLYIVHATRKSGSKAWTSVLRPKSFTPSGLSFKVRTRQTSNYSAWRNFLQENYRAYRREQVVQASMSLCREQ